MRSARGMLIVGLMAGLAPSAARAQDACGDFMRAPAKGGWAQYQVTDMKKHEQTTMRLAVVGGEQREGKDLVWIEMAMTSTHGNMIMQMLVPGYPYEPSGVQEIIMKAGNQPAMKMGPAMMGMIRSQMANNPGASMQEACKNVTLVGEESVTVPAGSFSTRHYRSTGAHAGDSWIARGQAFGLVKSTDGEHEMVLTGTGNDAKSSITETPQEMPGM